MVSAATVASVYSVLALPVSDGGQTAGVGSSHDAVPGYPRVLGVVPGQGQDAVADPGRREPGGLRRWGIRRWGRCRRGRADGAGLWAVTVRAQGQDRVEVGGLRRHGGVRVLRAGASRVRLDGGQAAGVGSSQDAVTGDVCVLGVVPGQGQDAVADLSRREPGGLRRWVVLHALGCHRGPWPAPLVYRAVRVVVAGANLDLVVLARRQVIQRERGHAADWIDVTSFCFVGIFVRQIVQARMGPDDPVVGGRRVGGLPGDDQLSRLVADESHGRDCAASRLSLGGSGQSGDAEHHGGHQQQCRNQNG